MVVVLASPSAVRVPSEDLPNRLKLFTLDPALVQVQPIQPTMAFPMWWTGRVVTNPMFHLGIRPNFYVTSEDNERAAAVTVQIRFDEILWATIPR